MKGFKSIQPKLKVEPITIKEPYKPEVKEFDDTDDFTRYFRNNEDAFKEPSNDPEKPAKFLTANKLNRTYRIPGYRIRIIRKGTDNEELTLVKDYHGKSTESIDEQSNESTNNELIERMDSNMEDCSRRFDVMQHQIDRLVEQINNIETFLCQLKTR